MLRRDINIPQPTPGFDQILHENMHGKKCGSLDGSPPPSYRGGLEDEDSGCSEDLGTSTLYGCAPDVKPEMNDQHRPIWDQDSHFDRYGQFGAVPYDYAVNNRSYFQHVPNSYPPPAYDHIAPSQLDSESDVFNDDAQVKTEPKSYDHADAILRELQRVHMVNAQLRTELMMRIQHQYAVCSQSMGVVQGQLSQAKKSIELWGEQTETNTKQLEALDGRCHDRHIDAQGSIKELSDLMISDIKERKKLRHCLEGKSSIQTT